MWGLRNSIWPELLHCFRKLPTLQLSKWTTECLLLQFVLLCMYFICRSWQCNFWVLSEYVEVCRSLLWVGYAACAWWVSDRSHEGSLDYERSLWTTTIPLGHLWCSRMPRCEVEPTADLVLAVLGYQSYGYNAGWQLNSRLLVTCERQCSSADRGRPLAANSAWRTLDNHCLAHPTRCFAVSACMAPVVHIQYAFSFYMIWRFMCVCVGGGVEAEGPGSLAMPITCKCSKYYMIQHI